MIIPETKSINRKQIVEELRDSFNNYTRTDKEILNKILEIIEKQKK